MDVWDCILAFHIGVAGLQDSKVGTRVGWTNSCSYRDRDLDAVAVGLVCEVGGKLIAVVAKLLPERVSSS